MTMPENPTASPRPGPGPTGLRLSRPPPYQRPATATSATAAPYGYAGQPMPGAPAYAQYAQPQGPIGHMRPTGMTMLLFFVTLGIWGFIYYYQTQEEMKRHSGEGIGGVIALVICDLRRHRRRRSSSATRSGQLYARRGQEPPVTALTALWFFPGMFILVGPFIWFVQTNNALNDVLGSLGAQGTVLV